MDWPESRLVLHGLMIDVQFEQRPRQSGGRAGRVDFERAPGWRKKVDVGLGGL